MKVQMYLDGVFVLKYDGHTFFVDHNHFRAMTSPLAPGMGEQPLACMLDWKGRPAYTLKESVYGEHIIEAIRTFIDKMGDS